MTSLAVSPIADATAKITGARKYFVRVFVTSVSSSP